jgi:hypothetical protein
MLVYLMCDFLLLLVDRWLNVHHEQTVIAVIDPSQGVDCHKRAHQEQERRRDANKVRLATCGEGLRQRWGHVLGRSGRALHKHRTHKRHGDRRELHDL